MAKRRLPSVCLDEHLPPEVKAGFKDASFRVFRAAESRYRGLDEWEYLATMYARNEVFVTADQEFVNDLADSGLKRHAGVVWLPKQLGREQREGFVELAAAVMRLWVKEYGQFAMRGCLLYPSQTGPTVWDGYANLLIASWARLAA